jgi:hypothetical protein
MAEPKLGGKGPQLGNQSFHHYASNEGIPLPATHNFNKAARVSLYDLIRYTPMNIRENRRKGCRTFFYGTQYFKRPGKRGIRIFAYKTGCEKSTYVTQIGFVDWRKGLKSSIWVHCTCDYFKYNVEYVLAQLGASELVFSWNQPPNIRNPKHIPHACKHILLIVDDALGRAKQFGKKDLEMELQDVDIDEIELTPFEKKKLEDKKRFDQLKEKEKLQKPSNFRPYSQQPKEEINEPAAKPTGTRPYTQNPGTGIHPYTQNPGNQGTGRSTPENPVNSPFSSVPRTKPGE